MPDDSLNKPALNITVFSILGTLVFFCVAIIGIWHHEIWRDEATHWLIVTGSTSVSDLLYNLRYTGHPGLWHILLFPVSRFTHNVRAMQIVHVIVASTSIFVLLRFSSFSRIQKILLTSSYFFLYEYALISRNYAIGILILFCFCALYRNKRHNLLLLYFLLALLAHVNMFCTIIAISLGIMLTIDNFHSQTLDQNRWRVHVLAIMVTTLGIWTAIKQMIPPPDSGILVEWFLGFNLYRFITVSSSIAQSFLPVPDIYSDAFWNTNLLIARGKIGLEIAFLLSVVLFIFVACQLIQYRSIFLGFLLSIAGCLGFEYIKLSGAGMRAHGHIFLMYLAALWLASYETPDPVRGRVAMKCGRFALRMGNSFLMGVLVFQAIAGIYAYSVDYFRPFSASQKAAEFIQNEKWTDRYIIAYREGFMSPFAALLQRQLFYPESGSSGTFITYDNKKKSVTIKQIGDLANDQAEKTGRDIVIITDQNLPFEKCSKIKTVGVFDDSIVGDEKFYVSILRSSSLYNKGRQPCMRNSSPTD